MMAWNTQTYSPNGKRNGNRYITKAGLVLSALLGYPRTNWQRNITRRCPSSAGPSIRSKNKNMKLKSPMAKGKRGEYQVRDILKEFGYEAHRTVMSGATPWHKGDIESNFPFFIEVKNTEKTKFSEWYHKAKQQSGIQPPIIMWTRNNEDMFCFIKLTDFLLAIQGKTAQPLPKPSKSKKIGLEESSGLMFSKAAQTHRNRK